MPKKSSKSKVKSSSKKTGFVARFRRMGRPAKILSVLVILLVATLAGTYGYSKWKENDLKAQAAGYNRVYNTSGFQIYVCKTTNRLRAFYVKPVYVTAQTQTFGYSGNIGNSSTRVTGSQIAKAWWGGVVSVSEVNTPTTAGWYLPRIYDIGRNKVHTPGYVSMAFTPWC